MDKRSSLLGPFESTEENEVLLIRLLESGGIHKTSLLDVGVA
jgi:hypothetical protein